MSFKAKEFLFYPVEDREPREGFYQQGSIVVMFKNGPSADDGFEDKALRVAGGGLCNSRGGCCSLKGREGAIELGDEGRFCRPSGITSSVEVTQGSGSWLNLLRSFFLLVVPRCFPHLPSAFLQQLTSAEGRQV